MGDCVRRMGSSRRSRAALYNFAPTTSTVQRVRGSASGTALYMPRSLIVRTLYTTRPHHVRARGKPRGFHTERYVVWTQFSPNTSSLMLIYRTAVARHPTMVRGGIWTVMNHVVPL
eukprot:207901-Prymnesium_polylepis.1